MSETVSAIRVRSERDVLPFAVELELRIEDRDVVAALLEHEEGRPRDAFAQEALKIGVLALRRAATALDGDLIKRETDRLLHALSERLDAHARLEKERLEASLREHFDPQGGQFSLRVRQLTAADGELATMLRSLLDGDESRLAKTLLSHVGQQSPLMKLLSPDQSQGLLAALRGCVETQLQQQRERILQQFSLNDEQSALSQLVRQVTARHGDLSKDLQEKIEGLKKEFSFDEENSSLNRLMRNVDRAQRTITSEFSLDNEQSALRRLKNELTTVLEAHVKSAADFQEEVKVALGKLVTRRETEARGTLHGDTFERALATFLQADSQRRGDLVEEVGAATGLIKNCKIGDAVLVLGPDHAAAGARIVFEAKEDGSYTLRRACDEIEQARKNRGAQHGVFVFSRRTAPDMEPLLRRGADVLVAWDPEDPSTDPFLRGAIEVARALAVRDQQSALRQKINFEPIDRALLDIEKRIANLDQVRRSAETIRSSSETILERVRIDREAFEKQLTLLQEAMRNVKQTLDDATTAGD